MPKIVWTKERLKLLERLYPKSKWDILEKTFPCLTIRAIALAAFRLGVKRDKGSYIKDKAWSIAAKKIGISFDEYKKKKSHGLKWCCTCKNWFKRCKFYKNNNSADKRGGSCRKCHKKKVLPWMKLKRRGRRFSIPIDGDSKQAGRRVIYLIRVGLLPCSKDLPCSECGHKYKKGGKKHEYHHYKGYAAEYHEVVKVLCTTCHSKKPKRMLKPGRSRHRPCNR